MRGRESRVKVSVSLDEDIIEKCKYLAEEDDRSFSQYVNLILRKWLKENGQNIENIKKD